MLYFQNPSQSVAVKVVTKKGLQKASEILVKEIKILRELTALHHTNLVAMHDCMDSPAFVYVVMEVSYCNVMFIYFLSDIKPIPSKPGKKRTLRLLDLLKRETEEFITSLVTNNTTISNPKGKRMLLKF